MMTSRSLSDDQLLFINGTYQAPSNGSTFPVVNPMTGKPIYSCAAATVDDYSEAIDHAHEAFRSWSRTPPSARRLVLLRAADILESYLDQDAPGILSSEVSAVKSWVQLNIKASATILRDTAGLVTHIKGEIIPADRPGTMILVERCPVGVVFAISPWNAPVSHLTSKYMNTGFDNLDIGQFNGTRDCLSAHMRQYSGSQTLRILAEVSTSRRTRSPRGRPASRVSEFPAHLGRRFPGGHRICREASQSLTRQLHRQRPSWTHHCWLGSHLPQTMRAGAWGQGPGRSS